MADDLDRLYGVPLAEFTATRNEIAGNLAAQGDERGAEIKALKKPSVVAWVVNQLPRRHPKDVSRLLDAGERLRKAHRKALSAAGAADLRDATRAEREVLGDLLARAGTVMRDAGIPASRHHLNAVEETLSAAAIDDEGRELLFEGRLTKELQRSGFGDLSGLTVIPGGRAETRRDETPSDRGESEARARHLEREAAAAQRDAARLQRSADAAAEKVRRLRAKMTEAEREAADARGAAALSRKRAAEARARADRAARR